MRWICYNGSFLPEDQPVISTQNRSFRYGDGVFETMRFSSGHISLKELHFDRLYSSLKALQIKIPALLHDTQLLPNITELCEKNQCTNAARVRLAAFREENNHAGYVLETMSLGQSSWTWSKKAWELCVHPLLQKSCDGFANLKSASFLPYVMAARFAAEQQVEECLLLNSQNFISDGSRTNLFLLKKNAVFTPALHQGCVNGVMRRYLISILKKSGYEVHQDTVSVRDLLHADEVFLTNAIIGLRQVGAFKDRNYDSTETRKIFSLLEQRDPYSDTVS